ncbi:MAG: COX15/CtaA family protein [Myxococcota bacterium]
MTESRISVTPFAQHRRAMAVWLYAICGLTFAMVVLGGLTRLTNSGLSMTTWSFTGSMPPLSAAAWQAEFARYQLFPEYQKINQGMSLTDFKFIYWFEYSHRMLGRFIGSVYLLPLIYFAARRAIPRWLAPRLIGLLLLLGLQGFIGWWMVKSGLVDRPDVSHLRLTTHLGTAFAFYSAMFWVATSLWRGAHPPQPAQRSGLATLVGITGLAVYGTVLLGGLVAGSNAGFSYNTFPRMGDRLIPDGYLAMTPAWRNFIDNIAAVQFNHRWVAITTFGLIVAGWAWSRRVGVRANVRRAMTAMLAAGLLQVSLGVSTLLTVVWLPLASAHQAGALVLLSTTLWALHVLRRPSVTAEDQGTIRMAAGT